MMLFRVVFIHPGRFLDFSGSWCTSSRLFALHPGSFWTCMYLIRVVFLSIQVLFCLDFYSQLIWVVFLQSGFSLILSWSLPHLVGVLFWSIQVLSDLVLVLAAPCRGSFFYQSGFFLKLSCYLQHLFRVVFWLFRVLSELVCSSSGLFSDQFGFFLNLSWYLPYLIGVLFWSNQVVSTFV